MASDAFVVGESWISEHYFTTEGKQSFHQRVLERRKQWDALDQSARSRVGAIAGGLSAALANRDDGPSDGLHDVVTGPLLAALGYDDPLYRATSTGPVTWYATAGVDKPSVAVLEAGHAETLEDLLEKDADTLLVPYEVEGEKPFTSVARALSAILVDDDAPEFVVVFAGRWALLVDRERWPEGRYLAVDVQLVADRNETKKGGELDRLTAILAAESVIADAEGKIWWQTIREESVKHTVGVSKDLREGVRLSIEKIANDVVQRRAAQNLDAIEPSRAQELAKQSLRFIYRILFLLYAEASPELKVLPVGAAEYEEGYSLDRLRDLVLVELTGNATERTHLYDSLSVLFRLIDSGSPVRNDPELTEGLTFNSLRADLFKAGAISLIAESKLSDGALKWVLDRLLLSKAQKGKDRGFISYADLGINQLGAVYEGLMSYTGFFATEDLHEVAPDGNAEKGSWIVPVTRSSHLSEKDFVKAEDPVTGEVKSVVHHAGSFVYRLSGRDRQHSASYYTPEVLTRFTVSQALEELLTPETTADDILKLTVCEPALGSGAFAIEAVRQLADQYLDRREAELGRRVDPDERPRELQKIKASIALHQVYGVDLNATAVELAEISLWLDTMSEGLQAPWFGLHLRRGNSLVGARRATFSRDQVALKGWLTDVPTERALSEDTAGAIHHFLLPATGWGATADAKEAKTLAPDAQKRVNTWRRSLRTKPTKRQLDQLTSLAHRVEALWSIARRRLEIAEAEARRPIPLWGQSTERTDDLPHSVSREEIETRLADPEGAYQRLRRVMDAWCAMWFWPLTDGAKPPTWDEWLATLTGILGVHFEAHSTKALRDRYAGGTALELPDGWSALNDAEEMELGFANTMPIAELIAATPWLRTAENIAQQYGFFHWELDFAPVFAAGGFDLQVGNPPWVRPEFDEDASLAEFDAWFALTGKPPIEEHRAHRQAVLAIDRARQAVTIEAGSTAATRGFLSSTTNYPVLRGIRSDLYRCFVVQTWRHATAPGIVGLIHPDAHFTDPKAGLLRAEAYQRLRRSWVFTNELRLFEIHHDRPFAVQIYGASSEVSFQFASGLYAPDTVERSLVHTGAGEEPGDKTDEGKWDTRPHKSRLQLITKRTLEAWHALLEDAETPLLQTRLVYSVNRSAATAIESLAMHERFRNSGMEYSQGWNEATDFRRGYFVEKIGPAVDWGTAILQGRNIFVGDPLYKSPNPSKSHANDWTGIDLEAASDRSMPSTTYKPAVDLTTFDAAYTRWGTDSVSARKYYRLMWRRMVNDKNERTLIAALIPPGTTHVDVAATLKMETDLKTVLAAGVAYSILADFMMRAIGASSLNQDVIGRLPLPRHEGQLAAELRLRVMRLSAVTRAYEDLWQQVFGTHSEQDFAEYGWVGGLDYFGRQPLGSVGASWSSDVPLRRASDRRQALVEIDALVAVMLGVSADELCTIYRSKFAVMYAYDRGRGRDPRFYDSNGRLVPAAIVRSWRLRGDRASVEERTATHPDSGVTYTYELPFVLLDREDDMRAAHDHFTRLALAERSRDLK